MKKIKKAKDFLANVLSDGKIDKEEKEKLDKIEDIIGEAEEVVAVPTVKHTGKIHARGRFGSTGAPRIKARGRPQ